VNNAGLCRPKLLNVDTSRLNASAFPVDASPHQDERQISLDTDRSFVLYPVGGKSLFKGLLHGLTSFEIVNATAMPFRPTCTSSSYPYSENVPSSVISRLVAHLELSVSYLGRRDTMT